MMPPGKSGVFRPIGSEVGVDHKIEHTLIRNLGIVDLDLVGLCKKR